MRHPLIISLVPLFVIPALCAGQNRHLSTGQDLASPTVLYPLKVTKMTMHVVPTCIEYRYGGNEESEYMKTPFWAPDRAMTITLTIQDVANRAIYSAIFEFMPFAGLTSVELDLQPGQTKTVTVPVTFSLGTSGPCETGACGYAAPGSPVAVYLHSITYGNGVFNRSDPRAVGEYISKNCQDFFPDESDWSLVRPNGVITPPPKGVIISHLIVGWIPPTEKEANRGNDKRKGIGCLRSGQEP